jgi:hypothetical protein
MLNKIKIRSIVLVFFTCIYFSGYTQSVKDISKLPWNIWLDEKASWWNDSLFLPPYQLKNIPVNAPTCGWSALYDQKNAVTTHLPATVEQYYWNRNGSNYGINGNYVGVSWFTTTAIIPLEWKGKNISIDFESTRMRTEVFVNNQLAGYHLFDGLPFAVDISKFVKYGTKNQLAVRITDPNGNFAWQDYSGLKWGAIETVPSHGFGGITGKVYLHANDNTYLEDIYVKNKREKDHVDVELNIHHSGKETAGEILYTLSAVGKSTILYSKKSELFIKDAETIVKAMISLPNAKLWSPDEPNLYTLTTEWKGKDGSHDIQTKRFGFRWFEVKEVNGDKMFFLNDKRIVLRSAISWGHWPVNGIFPTDEMAKKQILAAKKLGMNMLNFHRGIGQTNVLDLADELGLLYFEEPGGYRGSAYFPVDNDFYKQWKREKLLQMIRRDRSHPSLIIYNMVNESGRDPRPNEIADIREAHQLDNTRVITFSSNNVQETTPSSFNESIRKMHQLPYDTTLYKKGWWDSHNAPGPGIFRDTFYQSPTNYLRYVNNPKEIIFYGEENATGTPPRLQLIKQEIEKTKIVGWDGQQMIDHYNAFDKFLTKKGFKTAFKTVDELCLSFGAVSYYLQGRMIENIRISNTIDGYATNGWESTKLENHSGIVDVYRNFKADPQIIAHYNQPLYIAVKLKNKVVEKGDRILADIYLVNEKDLSGDFDLLIHAKNDKGITQSQSFPININGGLVYGQLLKEAISFNIIENGYTSIEASLVKNNKVVAKGSDEAFAVELITPNQAVFVMDTTGKTQELLKEAKINYQEAGLIFPQKGILLMGPQLQPVGKPGDHPVLNERLKTEALINWVAAGNTLIILQNAPYWCDLLTVREVTEYRGIQRMGTNWMGGNYFVRKHPLFEGLPVNTAFNWEYQSLAGYDRDRFGLRLGNDSCIVGSYSDHKNEMYSALSIINVGSGKIILNTLDLKAAILSKQRSAVVAKRILENMISYCKQYN